MRQVKVDNWGIYFLQRLKHFFNRTDYCDLTLQFMDNAQLKVHRLVLSACTEYFEVLERTCEMYEDYLIMPDDLQADVVVPIVNFMYTGQLEYKPEMLDKLIQTAQIMNIPVLAKLLDAQRVQKPYTPKTYKTTPAPFAAPSPPSFPQLPTLKRPAPKLAAVTPPPQKKAYAPSHKKDDNIIFKTRPPEMAILKHHDPSGIDYKGRKKARPPPEARPTRCEIPEGLDTDNIFSDSFTTISYDSKPLTVHPETTRRYPIKQNVARFHETFNSNNKTSVIDIVECKKVIKKPIYDSLFEDPVDTEMGNDPLDVAEPQPSKKRKSDDLFDYISQKSNGGPKVTIEAQDKKQAASIDHAKIISEVLKKYPHIVKGNKSIKLKILDTKPSAPIPEKKPAKKIIKKNTKAVKQEAPGSYESDVLNSKEAARLISLGALNITGPWICLICGTPGRAINFSTYHQFRRHLVEVHNEKPISTMCEYCGHKTSKRNYLLHHLYSKHNVPPPKNITFPKCNECDFIAMNPGHLVKHKMIHSNKQKICLICSFEFSTSSSLLKHINATGHWYKGEQKTHLQCVYCSKTFVREHNLFIHIKAHHNEVAKKDGIIEASDEEMNESDPDIEINQQMPATSKIKNEPNLYNTYDSEESMDPLGLSSEIVAQTKPTGKPVAQKLLNSNFEMEFVSQTEAETEENEESYEQNINEGEPQLVNNTEFDECVQTNDVELFIQQNKPVEVAVDFENAPTDDEETVVDSGNIKTVTAGQQVQIVVSNEEEYKALMGSNHPIIFDADGSTTKTLAVLTTPQSVPATSADVHVGNQTTENVMILQEDFACLSQANNGNIVVVYSHQIPDSEQKQYIVDNSFAQSQIATSGDMSTHYIQASTSVLTPNYTTTTTSVVDGQVVIPQSIVSWSGDIASDIISQQAQPEDHVMVEEVSVSTTNTTVNQCDEMEPTEQTTISQNDTINEQEMDSQDTSINVQSIESEVTEDSIMDTEDIEGTKECDKPTQCQVEEQEVEEQEIGQMDHNNSEKPKEVEETINEVAVDESNFETTSEEVTDNAAGTSSEQAMTNGSTVEYIPSNSVGKSNIENLTSEWSEDEMEAASVRENEAIAEDSADANPDSVEESIANIQQEVNSQLNANNSDAPNNVENENNEPVNIEQNITDENKDGRNNKISSLLNDWDENDETQEDDIISINPGMAPECKDTVDNAVGQTVAHDIVPKIATTNADIHTLVNDWEDEEESTE